MKKIVYIIAVISVVAIVLSVAGCTEKAQTKENELHGASEQVTTNEMTNADSNSSKEIDVVCKMKVDKSVIDKSEYKGKTYYFCSPYCKNEFDKDPEKFLNSQNNST
jgi:YHS domain-containing protein